MTFFSNSNAQNDSTIKAHLTRSVQAVLGLLKAPASPTVTWMGDATALMQASGLNVLVDPVFSERASPVQP